jgi:hypothetical protein
MVPMPQQTTTFKLLLISPGDVAEERQAVVAAVERWNATTGIYLSAHIVTNRWEFARPEMGAPPQEVINRQLVDDADFGIAIFWARLGSPTKDHPSGSAEEVERLLAKGANVMVYFSSKAVPQDLLKDDQYDKLQALRDDYKRRGLLVSFPDADKLAEMVSMHLMSLVIAHLKKERAGNPMGGVVVEVLASVENTKIGSQTSKPSLPAAAPPTSKRGLAAWVAANTTPRPAPRPYTREEIQFVTTYLRRQQEIFDELHDLEYKLLSAENKPFKVRDQQAIDAIKAQIADVQQRLKNFQDEAAKVAKQNFATEDK